MGFDAGEVGRDPDAERLLRSSYSPSMNYEVRRLQKMLRSFGGMDQVVRDASSIRSQALSLARAAVGPSFVHTSRAGLYADFAKLGRNLAGLNYNARMQSDAIRYGRTFGNLGLHSYVARTSKLQGIASINSADWRLRIVHSFRTPALQSILKASTTFGPIVVSPDDESASFDYHPDLKRWLIPETATDSGDAMDVERLLVEVIAFAVDVAQQYDSKALINVVGKHGGTFLIRVSETVVGGLILFWLLHR